MKIVITIKSNPKFVRNFNRSPETIQEYADISCKCGYVIKVFNKRQTMMIQSPQRKKTMTDLSTYKDFYLNVTNIKNNRYNGSLIDWTNKDQPNVIEKMFITDKLNFYNFLSVVNAFNMLREIEKLANNQSLCLLNIQSQDNNKTNSINTLGNLAEYLIESHDFNEPFEVVFKDKKIGRTFDSDDLKNFIVTCKESQCLNNTFIKKILEE